MSDILEFDPSKKKPRVIEQALPWPPSDGLVKEMELGLITEAKFAVPIRILGKGKTHNEVMKDLDNRRKL